MVQAYGAFIEVLVFYKMPNFLCLFVMCLSDLHVLIRLKSLYLFLERENLVRALRDSDCQNFKNNTRLDISNQKIYIDYNWKILLTEILTKSVQQHHWL